MKEIDKLNKVVNLNNKVVNEIANINKIIKKNDKKNKKIVIFDEKNIKINKSTINNSINNSYINSNNNIDNTTNNHIDTKNSNNNNNNTTNTINNNNNINNNITINAFGNENLDSITDKKKVSILNTYFCSLNALKTIHYDIPENCNFFLSNKRDRKYMQVFNGKECIYEDSNKFKDKLSSNIMNKLEEWFELHEEKFKKTKKFY